MQLNMCICCSLKLRLREERGEMKISEIKYLGSSGSSRCTRYNFGLITWPLEIVDWHKGFFTLITNIFIIRVRVFSAALFCIRKYKKI